MKNVKMLGTGMYVPKNKVYNEDIEKHFNKQGLSAIHLMEHLGRRKRYFIADGENTITMCQEAINNLVERHHIDLKTIEMIIVCTSMDILVTLVLFSAYTDCGILMLSQIIKL